MMGEREKKNDIKKAVTPGKKNRPSQKLKETLAIVAPGEPFVYDFTVLLDFLWTQPGCVSQISNIPEA